MGFSAGTDIMKAVIASVSEHVPDQATRRSIYIPIIEALDSLDWDTHHECLAIDLACDLAMQDVDCEQYTEDEDDLDDDGDDI